MNIPVMNTSDTATRAAAEAIAALGVGDTALARQKYAEAGAILEREMKVRHGGGEKQLLRFLAATQYYKGGDYQKAQELGQKIDAGALPKNVRGLLPQFQKDVKLRAAPGYAAGIRRVLRDHWLANRSRESISILQEHPYVIDVTALAFVRAALCDRLSDYRAAALFYAAALRRAPGVTRLAVVTAAAPLSLLSQGRLAEAQECVRHRLELLPHPVTYTTAAIVCYHRFFQSTGPDRQRRSEELLGFVEEAWGAYQKLPVEQRNDLDMRAYVALGFEIVARSWLQQGNKERSKEAWEQATKLGATRSLRSDSSEQGTEAEYLSERETHFSTRFAPEESIRQQLEMVEA